MATNNRKAKILLVRRNARRLAVGETQQPTDGVDEILRDDGLWFLQKAQRGAKPLEKPFAH